MFIIYAHIESLIRRTNVCQNNSEKSSPTKVDKYVPCGYSMSKIWIFDGIENKPNVCI